MTKHGGSFKTNQGYYDLLVPSIVVNHPVYNSRNLMEISSYLGFPDAGCHLLIMYYNLDEEKMQIKLVFMGNPQLYQTNKRGEPRLIKELLKYFDSNGLKYQGHKGEIWHGNSDSNFFGSLIADEAVRLEREKHPSLEEQRKIEAQKEDRYSELLGLEKVEKWGKQKMRHLIKVKEYDEKKGKRITIFNAKTGTIYKVEKTPK